MNIKVQFGEGRLVEAQVGEYKIRTDQPVDNDGDGTAPSPFDLFLASIATCAGYYVVNFCRSRGIDADAIELDVRPFRNPESHLIDRIEIEIMLPDDFPAKYEKAVIRAADLCAVKKHLEKDINFVTSATRVCT